MIDILMHHGHEHGCGHDHHHEHEHEHEHPHVEENEQIALLEYMHHHNEHHMEEFNETYEAIKENAAAAELLRQGIELLRQANEKFAATIAALKEE